MLACNAWVTINVALALLAMFWQACRFHGFCAMPYISEAGASRDRHDIRESLPYSKLPQDRALLRSAVEQGTFYSGVQYRAVREWLGKRQITAEIQEWIKLSGLEFSAARPQG